MFRALFGSSSELEQDCYGTFVVNMKFQNFSPRSSSVENRALLTITYNSFGNSSECFVQVTFGKNHRKIANEILIFFLSLHFDFCSIRWCTCFFFWWPSLFLIKLSEENIQTAKTMPHRQYRNHKRNIIEVAQLNLLGNQCSSGENGLKMRNSIKIAINQYFQEKIWLIVFEGPRR